MTLTHVTIQSICEDDSCSNPYVTESKRKQSYLFLRESVAPPHLADLVALLVPAGRAVAAVVLLLAAATLTTPLALLLCGLLLSHEVRMWTVDNIILT